MSVLLIGNVFRYGRFILVDYWLILKLILKTDTHAHTRGTVKMSTLNLIFKTLLGHFLIATLKWRSGREVQSTQSFTHEPWVSTVVSHCASVSCWAKAGGNVLPQGPLKWNLKNIHWFNSLSRIVTVFLSQVSNPLEAQCSRSVFHVEFSHWDACRCCLRSKDGCWIHHRRGTDLSRD